jgi:hypothetical protein
MNDEAGLERRYRRLLAWYPAEHRHAHGDEMIGVLLASARDGQRHPHPADGLDLALGGLRIRLRAVLAGRLDARFTDALAAYSIAAPVMWLISYIFPASALIYRWLRLAHTELGLPYRLVPLGFEALFIAFVAVPVILAWRGHRRSAVLVATVPAVFETILALRLSGTSAEVAAAAASLLLTLQATALAIAPGPTRGAELLTKRAWAVLCVAGLAAAVPYTPHASGVLLKIPLSAVVTAVACAAAVILAGLAVTLPPAIGRRLIALLAAPAYLYVIAIPMVDGSSTLISGSLAAVYLPALALIVLMATAGWLGARRRLKPTV